MDTPPSFNGSGTTIKVLGDFTATSDGISLVARNGVLATVVKAVVVLGPIDGEQLASIVWPDDQPEQNRTRLLNTVGRLRREWGNVVVRRADDAFLIGPEVWVDLHEFRRLTAAATAAGPVSEAAADAARQAVGLYAGDLLPFDRYRTWAAAPRDAAKQRFLDMLQLLAEVDERNGDMLKAVAWLERAIDADPENPQRYLWAARLLVAGSRQGRANMMLRRAKSVVDALGVAPPEEYHRILADASA